jgi:hypothetical protein
VTPIFTVLIGSIGRNSLKHTLDSIARQKREPGDQVFVAVDTFEDDTHERYERVYKQVLSYGHGFDPIGYDAGYHFYGVEQINYTLYEMPRGCSHIFTLGDDDVFVDGAYECLRDLCAQDMERPILYKFLAPWREILWERPVMTRSRISGCCIAAPKQFVGLMDTKTKNDDGTEYKEHDFDWMQGIIRKSGKEPLWLDDVLVIARPEARGNDVTHQPLRRCWNCNHWRFGEDVSITDLRCPKCKVVLPVKGVKEVAA